MKSDKDLHLRVGDLHLWIKKKGEEIWVAHEYEEKMDSFGQADEGENPPENLKWSRWAPKSVKNEIKVAPIFPELPVVVSSEYPLRIAPKSEILIFTRVPVWVQVSLPDLNYVLTEIPTSKLSRTWFGTPVEGELCYWLSTKARRSLDELVEKPHVIDCPITIANQTVEDLNFEKFCLRVDRLSIFEAKNDLWADETRIEYQGEDQNSDISMTGKLPQNVGKGTLLSKPRNPVSKSIATRTFKMLFDDNFISAR